MSIRTEKTTTINELALKIDKATKEALQLLLQNCVRCDRFNEAKEVCTLVNARPPAKVIAEGCEKFIDEIPF